MKNYTNIKITKLPNCEVEIEGEITAERLQEMREHVVEKVVQNAEVGFTQYKRNGSGWLLLGGFHPDFEAEMEDMDVSYEFRGETAPLESFLASITKQELQIKVMKSFAS